MPYTFSHIGFTLPFQKKWESYFSTSGLVFGSIAPDYDILFRFTENRFHIFTYSIFNIVFLIFPLALISSILYHAFCKNVVINYLPDYFQNKYHSEQSILSINLFSALIKISFSIFFAILLHLFLDYCCHYFDAYEAKKFVLSQTENLFIANTAYILTIYLLPILFTIAGFILLFRIIFRSGFKLDYLYLPKDKILFWILFFLCTVFLSILKISLTSIEKKFILDFFAITFTSSAILAFYITCGSYFIVNKIWLKK